MNKTGSEAILKSREFMTYAYSKQTSASPILRESSLSANMTSSSWILCLPEDSRICIITLASRMSKFLCTCGYQLWPLAKFLLYSLFPGNQGLRIFIVWIVMIKIQYPLVLLRHLSMPNVQTFSAQINQSLGSRHSQEEC